MQISEPVTNHKKSFALFALGFRPFFLLAGLSALLLMVIWLLAFSGEYSATQNVAPVYWHAHEMIFGFAAAVIAGFLLTAVKNWTGVQTVQNTWLLLLSLIWLLPRFLYLFDTDLIWLALFDLLFLPLVALAIAIPIVKVKQWNNLFFSGLLLLMATANFVFYLQFFSGLETATEWGIHAGLGVVLIIITVMAGRVIGFFIERGLNARIKNISWVNHLALWGTVIFVAGQSILPSSILGLVIVMAIIGHFGRLISWYDPGIWGVPLLWVLYLGYAWLASGFVLTLLELYEMVPESLAVHMFTVGGIGVITLGMMARVALGHTGREMRSHWLINLSFVLVNLAVIVRVLLPLFWPSQTVIWVQLAAFGWIMAFACFVLIYLPILLQSRVDGRPG